MSIFKHIKEGNSELYTFLKKSFPKLTFNQYQKVNNGKKFLNWILLYDSNEVLVASAAVFKRDKYFKMGLFCVNPEKRKQGIGTTFYKYITQNYSPLEWTSNLDSKDFYLKMGAHIVLNERISFRT